MFSNAVFLLTITLQCQLKYSRMNADGFSSQSFLKNNSVLSSDTSLFHQRTICEDMRVSSGHSSSTDDSPGVPVDFDPRRF